MNRSEREPRRAMLALLLAWALCLAAAAAAQQAPRENPALQAIDNTLARIEAAVYHPVADLKITAWRTAEPVPFARRQSGQMLSLKEGQEWGKLWDCAWFRFEGTVPAAAAGKQVVLLLDVSGELCVVDAQGNPIQGLTCVSSDFDRKLGLPGKRVFYVTGRAAGGEAIDLWADAGDNDLFGKYRGGIKNARIATRDNETLALYYDAWVLEDLYRQLPPDSERAKQILGAFGAMQSAAGDLSPAAVQAARRALAPELARKNAAANLTVTATGHAHIDLAWLWPLRETRRKAARTFATALINLERYPDYHFAESQAQMYDWIRQDYPGLYARVKQAVAAGRIEPAGAMWVESDVNIVGGESLVRQILFGQSFWRREFGRTSQFLWLPDTFGYPAYLPQIAAKAGLKYFVSSKPFNDPPHTSFWWRGIDGTRLLTHLLPEGTYNSPAAPRSLVKIDRSDTDQAAAHHALLAYGIGDGGGGPGEEHLERLAREKNMAGLPALAPGSIERFLEAWSKDAGQFPLWAGEMRWHGGTYTSQANNKRYNRLMELGLRRLEWRSVMGGAAAGVPWPADFLDLTWKETLLYQFHDILPGSAITRVYAESCARYAEMLKATLALADQTDRALAAKIDTSAARRPIVVLNDLGWERTEWLEAAPGRWLRATVPAMGHAVADAAAAPAPAPEVQGTTATLENALLRLRFDDQGWLTSVWDKELGREWLRPGQLGNTLVVFDDTGDAWNYPRQQPHQRLAGIFKLERAEIVRNGPQVTLVHHRRYMQSSLTQRVIMTAGSRRIDFVTDVDWQDVHRTLRTAFPLSTSIPTARCEIPYGVQTQPASAASRSEFPIQRWVDISTSSGGVALLNDCKYGASVRDNVLELGLLRSPTNPDPKADIGRHQFTYSLYPHGGDAAGGGVARAAYELNVPLRALEAAPHAGTLPARYSAFSVAGAPTVVLDWVKRAEDGDGVIVRLYESAGQAAQAQVRTALPVAGAALVNLMEENPQALEFKNGEVAVTFKPFEIQTVRLKMRSGR